MQSMILFYSEFCQHCNVLLDTIKRFDKNNTIKLLSIDTLRSLKKPIDPRIHSVPALFLLDTKKYMFGKEVFDYLILKNKLSFAGETTRNNKKLKDNLNGAIQGGDSQMQTGLPQAFSLGAISAETFSSFNDQNSMINDKNYKWDIITNECNTIMPPNTPFNLKDGRESSAGRDANIMRDNGVIRNEAPTNIPDTLRSINTKDAVASDTTNDKKLPTLEDIMKQRATDIM